MSGNDVTLRAITELDLEPVSAIDEKITGTYRPGEWERRFGYYLRRDPEGSLVAESGGKVVGFMLGEVRAGEFGLEEPSGWIEVLGVDPDCRGREVGRRLLEGMLDNFRERGAKTVRTLVNEENQGQLVGFFRKNGFASAPIVTLEQDL